MQSRQTLNNHADKKIRLLIDTILYDSFLVNDDRTIFLAAY